MPQSLVQNYMHIIFSTKNRIGWLREAESRCRLHAYLAGACGHMACPAFQVGGSEDHIHMVVALSKNIALKDLVMGVKKESSKWVRREV